MVVKKNIVGKGNAATKGKSIAATAGKSKTGAVIKRTTAVSKTPVVREHKRAIADKSKASTVGKTKTVAVGNHKTAIDNKSKVTTDGKLSLLETKLKYARKLSNIHRRVEDTISGVAYITSASEADPKEPIKVMEINSATSAAGFFPIMFGPTERIPFTTTLIELTPKEARAVEKGTLEDWPKDWEIGKWLYKRPKKQPKSLK